MTKDLTTETENTCQLRLFVLIQKHNPAIIFFMKNDNFIFSELHHKCKTVNTSKFKILKLYVVINKLFSNHLPNLHSQ